MSFFTFRASAAHWRTYDGRDFVQVHFDPAISTNLKSTNDGVRDRMEKSYTRRSNIASNDYDCHIKAKKKREKPNSSEVHTFTSNRLLEEKKKYEGELLVYVSRAETRI